jgi:hypothetical protein
MGKWNHRLSNINEKDRTAQCELCGPVPVKRKQDGWRCSIAERKWKRKCRPKPRPVMACEICGKSTPLVWDHDHLTGQFRGWLCHACNVMLGFAYDNPLILEQAIHYLKRKSPSK